MERTPLVAPHGQEDPGGGRVNENVRTRGQGLITEQPEEQDEWYESWLQERLYEELLKEMS